MAKFDWTKASVVYPDPARVQRSTIEYPPKDVEQDKLKAEKRKAKAADTRKRKQDLIGRRKRKLADQEAAADRKHQARYKAYLLDRETWQREKAERDARSAARNPALALHQDESMSSSAEIVSNGPATSE